MNEIHLQMFDPAWEEQFEEEAGKITALLGKEVVIVHHIGSTAIPDILARPIIDILVEVKDIEKVDSLNPSLKAIGYDAVGEHGIEGRRFFIKKDMEGNRTHNLFIFQLQHDQVGYALNFRDYLITHPKEARFYSLLKQELAKQHAEDLAAYMRGKEAFIQQVLLRAADWRQSASQERERQEDDISEADETASEDPKSAA